jgi:hypothetical protein
MFLFVAASMMMQSHSPNIHYSNNIPRQGAVKRFSSRILPSKAKNKKRRNKRRISGQSRKNNRQNKRWKISLKN